MEKRDKFLVYTTETVVNASGESSISKIPVCRGIGILQQGIDTRYFDENNTAITNALFIDGAFSVNAGQLVEVGGNVWRIFSISKHPNGSAMKEQFQRLLLVFQNA